MEGCWQRLKENRWKVAGVALVVVTVLAAGTAAQHQLSHTSLAVSLPLGDLAAAASSGQENTLSEASHEADSIEGAREQHNREVSSEEEHSNLVKIIPVKLTQGGTPEVLDGASASPGTLLSEKGEPFFIVANDVTADIANDSPSAIYEEPQLDTRIPDDGAEAPPSTSAEVQDKVVTSGRDDSLYTHSLNDIDETDQNISSPDDHVEIFDPSVVSGERAAKAIEAADIVEAEVFPQPLAEDSVLQVEQSFGVTLGEVFTESTPASTLPIEAQFQDLSQREGEAPPTEMPVTESFTDFAMEDAPPTDPAAVDSQPSPEIYSDEQTPSRVPAKISADEETLAPVPLENVQQEPSPAPNPVRITLDEPASTDVRARLSAEEAETGQTPHELSVSARESHDLKTPQTQPEPGIAEVAASGFENKGDSPESHDHTQASLDIPNPDNAATETAQKDPPTLTNNAALLEEVTSKVQFPASENEELSSHLNKAAITLTTAGAAGGGTSEQQFDVGRLSHDVVLLVEDLPQGSRLAPEDTVNPFAAKIENFNPDAPIDAEELSAVPEWIADDSISGETFNHSDVIELPNMPMDDIEIFFLAEDPEADSVLSTEVQGVGVTEVKQQLHKDEVHIAALPDAVPFSPSEVQLTPQMQEAVKDALQEEIAAMGVFGMKVPDGAVAAVIPSSPAPITFPAQAPAPFSEISPASGPSHTLEVDTFNPVSKPIINPAQVQGPVKVPIQNQPSKPITRPTSIEFYHPIQESVVPETTGPNIRPEPAKIQRPAAPPPTPTLPSVPAPAPIPQVTEAPAAPIIHQPPSSSQSYRRKPKPNPPRSKPTSPRPKPARPTYQPQSEPTNLPYKPPPRPTRPQYRPTKPTTSYTHPPPSAHPPPIRHPISFVNFEEPKPEHFVPPSYHGPIPQLPTSYDDFSSPPRHPPRPSPPRPAPRPPSYKPPPSASYEPPSTSYKHPSSTLYKTPAYSSYKPQSSTSHKPPSTSYRPPSSSYSQKRPSLHKARPSIKHPPATPSSPYYRPPTRPKPSPHATHYEKPLPSPPKSQYRPAPTTQKPPVTQKPILAPVLVPADLSSLVFPKGVTFSGHKSRPSSLFHLPSFFRTERKQRLQVPESVVSRLDSDQPDWVDDLEPDRR